MKNLSKIFLTSAITLFFAMQANAQSNVQTTQAAEKTKSVNSASSNFVDKDSNGVCDNRATRKGNGRGANFNDKNGDGVCDNQANAGNKRKNGQGNQNRNGQCRGPRNCGKK
jgi:hypothetical protein